MTSIYFPIISKNDALCYCFPIRKGDNTYMTTSALSAAMNNTYFINKGFVFVPGGVLVKNIRIGGTFLSIEVEHDLDNRWLGIARFRDEEVSRWDSETDGDIDAWVEEVECSL